MTEKDRLLIQFLDVSDLKRAMIVAMGDEEGAWDYWLERLALIRDHMETLRLSKALVDG